MTDAPERIWAWVWDLPYPSRAQGKPEWNAVMQPEEQDVTAYVRDDIHAALEAESARLRDALVHLRGIYDCADIVNAALTKGDIND